MNNTLTHPGLSYSHPSYAPLQPNLVPVSHQSSLSMQPHARSQYNIPNNSLQPNSSQVSNNNLHLNSISHQQTASNSNHLNHHNVPQKNYSNLGLPLQIPTLSIQSNNNPNMYPQTSVYINPYIGSTSSHHHHSTSIQPHLHGHPYIAPPPAFNMPSHPVRHGGGVGTYQLPSPGYSTTHDAGQQSYGGVMTTASGSMVPYNPTYTTGYPALPYSTYRYSTGGGYCQPPTPQLPSVDDVLLCKLQETHRRYLEKDDSPAKLELRKDMDDLTQRFVSVTTHANKFHYPGVRAVLEASVVQQPHFDAFKAAAAFDALASYAANLVTNPWRREYTSIKLYSGYWVHNVADHLVNAESVLRLMGYSARKGEAGCYQLPGAGIDVDVVSRVALDCHIACCECQVLGQLRQEFHQLTYNQLLQYRQISVGSCEETVQKLVYFLKLNPDAGSVLHGGEVGKAGSTALAAAGAGGSASSLVATVGSDVEEGGDCGGCKADGIYRRHSEEGLVTATQLSRDSRHSNDSSYRKESSIQVSRMGSSKCHNLQCLPSKSSVDTVGITAGGISPKKSILGAPSSDYVASSNSDLTRRLDNSSTLSHQRSKASVGSQHVNSSLPSTPSSVNTILDRPHDPGPPPVYSRHNKDATDTHTLRQDTNHTLRQDTNHTLRQDTNHTLRQETNHTLRQETNHTLRQDTTKHKGASSDRAFRVDTTTDGKYNERSQSRLIHDQLEHLASATSAYMNDSGLKPNRHERYREGLSKLPNEAASSVAIAQLIDHEEAAVSQRHHRDEVPPLQPCLRHASHNLPKVLPDLRPSKHRAPGLTESSDLLPPLEATDVSLPQSIPNEVFEDGTFEEHMRDSYNLLKEAQRTESSVRKGTGQSYKDTWGFVIHDLEKKGYNKDVGNRGDILHINSKSSPSNLATNLTNSAANATNTLVAKSGGKYGMLGEGETAPDLIPSTVQNFKKERDRRSTNRVPNLTEAFEQLEVNGTRGRTPHTTPSSSSSTARNRSKADDCYSDDKCKYPKYHAEKYSSECSDKRNSIYDNVSYGGFETARQDTDDDDDELKKRQTREVPSYSQVCSNAATAPSGRLSGSKGTTARGQQVTSSSNSSNGSSSRYINAVDSNPAPQQSSSGKSASKRSPLSTLSNKLSRELQHSKESLLDPVKGGGGDSTDSRSRVDTKHKAVDSSAKVAPSVGKATSCSSKVTPWSCVSCTFYNEKSGSVCEMCSRSRQPPGATGIRPLVAGGRECDQCTLINDKDATKCSACGFKLDTCPTYI